MTKAKKPICPRCKTAKNVVAQGVVGDMFVCTKCGGLLDSDPLEGGDFSDHNPAARLEREERRKKR